MKGGWRHKAGFGWGSLSQSHCCPKLSLWSPGIRYEMPPHVCLPHGVCPRKGHILWGPRPAEHTLFPATNRAGPPVGWIWPRRQQVRFWRAAGRVWEGAGRAVMLMQPQWHSQRGGITYPPPFLLDPPQKVLSGQAKPWKVLSPRPA